MARINNWDNPVTRELLMNKRRARFSSEDERRKQSERIKRAWASPELRKRQSNTHKIEHEVRKNISSWGVGDIYYPTSICDAIRVYSNGEIELIELKRDGDRLTKDQRKVFASTNKMCVVKFTKEGEPYSEIRGGSKSFLQ